MSAGLSLTLLEFGFEELYLRQKVVARLMVEYNHSSFSSIALIEDEVLFLEGRKTQVTRSAVGIVPNREGVTLKEELPFDLNHGSRRHGLKRYPYFLSNEV